MITENGMEDLKNLIVVSALNGEKYIGWLPASLPRDDGNKIKLLDAVESGKPIRLLNARAILNIPQMSQDRAGNAAVGRLIMSVPVDLMQSPIPELYLLVSTWYFPSDLPESSQAQYTQMLKSAEDNETASRAAAAGLVMGRPKMPPAMGGQRG